MRGIAILAIVVINIESFAYPRPWSNYLYGFITELDVDTRFWVYSIFQGKFYGVLAILFGASLSIIVAKQPSIEQALRVNLARLFGLFLLGVLHAYLIWSGDILYHYAAVGVFALSIIMLGNRAILVMLCISLVLSISHKLVRTYDANNQYQAYVVAKKLDEAERTEIHHNAMTTWERKTRVRAPRHTESEYQLTFIDHWKDNFAKPEVHRGKVFYSIIFWPTLSLMLIGALLFHLKLFHDYRKVKSFKLWLVMLLVLSVTSSYFRFTTWTYTPHEPNLSYFIALITGFNKEIQATLYVLLLSVLYQKYIHSFGFATVIRHVGKTALSNYVFQSVMLTFVFYVYGLYNNIGRSELLPICGAIMTLQLVCSWLVMKRFSMGPLEKLLSTFSRVIATRLER